LTRTSGAHAAAADRVRTFLQKPFEALELVSTLEDLLGTSAPAAAGGRASA